MVKRRDAEINYIFNYCLENMCDKMGAIKNICSKSTAKTLQQHQAAFIYSKSTSKHQKYFSFWCCSGVFIVNFEQTSHIALVFLLLTLKK